MGLSVSAPPRDPLTVLVAAYLEGLLARYPDTIERRMDICRPDPF